MRRWTIATLVLALLSAAAVGAVLVAPSAFARRTHRSRCLPHGSETIVLDRSVRVYSIPEYVEGVLQKHKRIYACLFRPGTTLALEPAHRRFPRHSLGPFTLAGTVLAFVD